MVEASQQRSPTRRCADNSPSHSDLPPHTVGPGLHFLSRSRRERKGTCLDSAIRSHTNHVACLYSNLTKTGWLESYCHVLLSISTTACRIQSKSELSEHSCFWLKKPEQFSAYHHAIQPTNQKHVMKPEFFPRLNRCWHAASNNTFTIWPIILLS